MFFKKKASYLFKKDLYYMRADINFIHSEEFKQA